MAGNLADELLRRAVGKIQDWRRSSRSGFVRLFPFCKVNGLYGVYRGALYAHRALH